MGTVKNFFRNMYLKSVFELPKNVKVNGNMEAGNGYIDGNIEGDIKSESNITLGKNAAINGNVYANNLIVYGKVYGNVKCTNKVIVAGKGYIKGNISGIIIDVEEGAIVEGIIKKISEAEKDSPEEITETGTDENNTAVKNEAANNSTAMESWF